MKKLTIYNNVREHKTSPLVPVFNPCYPDGKPIPRSLWASNNWAGHSRVVIDWEEDNHFLTQHDHATTSVADSRARAFAMVRECREAGVKTLGAYAWPWVRHPEDVERVVQTNWPHVALLDWVCPSFYWYEESVSDYQRKTASTIAAIGQLSAGLRPFKVVPFLSIESMKKGSGARPLLDEEIVNQARAVAAIDSKLLGGVLVWSMLGRWKWLYDLYLRGSLKEGHAAWGEMKDAEEKMSLRGICTAPSKFEYSFARYLGVQILRVRRALALVEAEG